MDEELLLPTAAADATNSNTGTSVVVVSVSAADSYKFQVGDLVTVMDEGAVQHAAVLRVTAVNNSTGDLTVAGWANHTARSADRTIRSNYTQIFGPTPIHMSRTEQQVVRYGVSDEFAKQVYGRSVENVITREQAFLYGQPVDDTTNKMRSTGGLNYWISSNIDTTTTLTIAALESVMNDISDNDRVRTVIDDPRRGRVPVTSVFHEFGETQLVRNRWVHKETAFVIKKENVSRRVIQPLVVEALAKTGDADKVQIVCEEGLQVKGESHMAKFTTLTGY